MKKFLSIMFAAFAMVSVAQAEVLADVGVGATTNKIFRGETLSARGASANLNVKLTHAETGIFGTYDLNTVAVAPRDANLLHVVSGGIGHRFGDVAVQGGYRYFGWTGGSALGKTSDLNWGEVFVAASAYGFTGEYAKTVNASVINPSNDAYGRIGYAHSFGKLTVGGGVSNTWYQAANVSKIGYDVGAAYALTEDLSVSTSYVVAGKDAAGVDRQNQVAFSVAYKL